MSMWERHTGCLPQESWRAGRGVKLARAGLDLVFSQKDFPDPPWSARAWLTSWVYPDVVLAVFELPALFPLLQLHHKLLEGRGCVFHPFISEHITRAPRHRWRSRNVSWINGSTRRSKTPALSVWGSAECPSGPQGAAAVVSVYSRVCSTARSCHREGNQDCGEEKALFFFYRLSPIFRALRGPI